MASNRGREPAGPPVTSNQLPDALAAPAHPYGDLARGKPVVVLGHPHGPSTDTSTLDVLDRRQDSILLRVCFTVEQTQNHAVSLQRERSVVATSFEERIQ